MIFDPILDLFRGKAVTIPPLDGAFRPNTALDDLPQLLQVAAPDNLVAAGGRILFSSGANLHEWLGGQAPVIATHEVPISALALSARAKLAVALSDGRLLVDGQPITLPAELRCLTALAFDGEDALIFCNGSARYGPEDWAVDLMEKNAGGSVWRVSLTTDKVDRLATGLAFPQGIFQAGDAWIIAESWRHRLIRLPLEGGAPMPVLEKLPGYPARLTAAAEGGAWLSLFAPRNRLVEFVLQEQAYRADMLASVPRPYWIAPSLSSGASFLEPLQCGGIKTMGIHKPWAPSRSYGLVARLDSHFRPVASYHSRANGTRHGITSLVELEGGLLISAKGGNALLELPLAGGL